MCASQLQMLWFIIRGDPNNFAHHWITYPLCYVHCSVSVNSWLEHHDVINFDANVWCHLYALVSVTIMPSNMHWFHFGLILIFIIYFIQSKFRLLLKPIKISHRNVADWTRINFTQLMIFCLNIVFHFDHFENVRIMGQWVWIERWICSVFDVSDEFPFLLIIINLFW